MSEANWQKLNELFAAAAELDPPAREEFLRRIEDEGLRREVGAMLAAARQADAKGFLGADAFRAGARVLAGVGRARPRDGERIGGYRLVREIGSGGMGVVYLAEREEFCQQVAVKVVKRGMDTEEIVRRFERERELLASLNHPNIARLLDGGTTDDGLPFLVMEYVEGEPLTEFCDRRRLGIEERLALFRKICDAVASAHLKLIVHRDIKPSNILVTREGEPKLLDFGIAKLLAAEEDGRTLTLTVAEQRLLTPEYASPEQLRGERVTPASDVYSLGALLYELLCGRRPFRLKNRSAIEVLRIVTEREPAAPSTAAVTAEKAEGDGGDGKLLPPERVAELRRERPQNLRRRLFGDLDNITLKALGKEPGARYGSAAQLSEDIGRYLAGLPVSARRATLAYRAAKFARRNRATVALTGLLALLVFAVGASWAYFLWGARAENRAAPPPPAVAPAGAARTLAVLPFKAAGRAGGDEPLRADLTDTLIARLGRIQELEVRPASAVAPYAGRDPLAAGRELRVEAVLESDLEKTGERVRLTSRLLRADGGGLLWSGTFEETLANISNAQDAIAERVAATLLGQLTVEQRKKVKKRYTDNAEAYRLYLQGKHLVNLQNERSLNQSIQYFNRAIELEPGYALAYTGIADAYLGISGVYLTAHEAFPKIRAAAIKALELDPELAEARIQLAMVLATYDWNWAAADAEFKQAIELNPNYVNARHWYARHLALTGRLDEAAAQFRRARELDPLSPYIASDSALPDFMAGNYDRAIEQTGRALAIDNRFWFAYWVRGWARQQKGDLPAAIADYKKALSIEASANVRSFLANAYAVSGRREEARKILDGLLEMRKKQYVGSPYIAAVYAGLGDREQTFAWLEKSYEEREEWMLWMRHDRRFGEMRKDPRFQDLLRRIGLPG